MIHEIKFSSVSEYLEILRTLPIKWDLNSSSFWFRGVNDHTLSLQPGCVWRNIDIELEESFVLEFLLNYRSYHESPVENPLELYALMQHYGMPTRLLDWSSSTLVALYFALEKPTPTKSVVWVMSPVDLNNITSKVETNFVPRPDFENCVITEWLPSGLNVGEKEIPTYPIAFKHPHVNKRIQAQKGCFTLHGTDTHGIEQTFEEADNKCLLKLVISEGANREQLLNQLYAIGFKEDDIYQDLNSLSRRIIREQSVLITT